MNKVHRLRRHQLEGPSGAIAAKETFQDDYSMYRDWLRTFYHPDATLIPLSQTAYMALAIGDIS
jgi:hypothetical protein